ncbi:MAG TPA: pitrilysin family protein [Flavitalea sp.]|nr:pitrilysin family protein [Flavitalea sp.]
MQTAEKRSATYRTVVPKIKLPVEFNVQLPPCKRFTLTNGVEVFAIDMGGEDTLMLNWVFYAGNWYEAKKMSASATNYLLKNGTSRLTAFGVNEHFEYFGSYLNRTCYNETAELTLHCLNKHVNELIPVVAEIITDSVFPEEELLIYKQNSQQRLKVSLQKCEFVAGQLIDAYLFGNDHPYGKYSRLEDYEALQREEIQRFYKEYYQNGRCVIFAAGKLPPDLPEQLEQYFGKLPLRAHTSKDKIVTHPVTPATEKKQHITIDPQGVQTAIRIARPFPNRHHSDFQKAMVLNNVYGGFFGSRLMTNIREEKGYTYGIYSYLMNHVDRSGWMISTEAGRDVSEATVHEIYKEMDQIREQLIDDDELMVTRNYMIGTILGDLDGPFQVAARWKNLILNDLDEAYFHQGIETIKTVTAKELQDIADKYLRPKEFYELLVV